MAALKPEFTDSFAVQTDNYGDFIRLVRQHVIVKCDDRRPGVVQPVLPPEETIPKFWFHVVLRTMTSSLTLAVRMDNLYLVGFKTPAGEWWEFNNEGGTHLISNSKWLGFGGRYQDLIGSQKGLHTVTLGRAQVATAVDVLAKHGTTKVSEEQPRGAQADSYAVPKTMLAKLVIMINEGVRFHTVYSTVDKEFNNVAATLSEIEGKQVNRWDRISAEVIKCAKDPTAKFPDELKALGVKDNNDAARIVAIVKDQKDQTKDQKTKK